MGESGRLDANVASHLFMTPSENIQGKAHHSHHFGKQHLKLETS